MLRSSQSAPQVQFSGEQPSTGLQHLCHFAMLTKAKNNLCVWPLIQSLPWPMLYPEVSWKSLQLFLHYPADKHTNGTENTTSLVEVKEVAVALQFHLFSSHIILLSSVESHYPKTVAALRLSAASWLCGNVRHVSESSEVISIYTSSAIALLHLNEFCSCVVFVSFLRLLNPLDTETAESFIGPEVMGSFSMSLSHLPVGGRVTKAKHSAVWEKTLTLYVTPILSLRKKYSHRREENVFSL